VHGRLKFKTLEEIPWLSLVTYLEIIRKGGVNLRNIVLPLLILVLVLSFIAGCSSKTTNKLVKKNVKPDLSSLLKKLDELGYYKYIDSSQIERVKNISLDAGYVFGWEDSGRDFSADAENLAEGGIPEFYNEIRNFLKKQNVDISVYDDFSDKGYTIKINGKNYVIYDEKELKSENIWEVSTIRSFSIINSLLKESNSKERLYTLYGGNDLRAVFLTEEMYRVIIESNILPEKELPQPVPDTF